MLQQGFKICVVRYNYAKRKKRFNVNTAFEERRKDIRLLTDDIRL